MVAVYVVIVLITLLLIALFVLVGGRERIGECLMKLFPFESISVGDRVDIFLDGELNRTATITNVSADSLTIYHNVHLPVSFRGQFYAVGICQDDGSKLVYVKTRRFYKLVRAAEIVRHLFNVLDSEHTLVCDSGDTDNDKEVEDEL